MSRLIVLDTETTGLSAEGGDRIIEIGCVELINRKLSGNNLHYYLNPERDSHEDALRVHGISNEFLRDKPKFSAIADELLNYLNGAEVIIHNAAFDVGFLNKELERAQRPPLKAVVAKVDNSGRTLHGALLDAELLADVYIYMTRGQDALLVEASPEEVSAQSEDAFDWQGLELPVLRANEQELAAHEAVLAQLDKSSNGQTVWRKFVS